MDIEAGDMIKRVRRAETHLHHKLPGYTKNDVRKAIQATFVYGASVEELCSTAEKHLRKNVAIFKDDLDTSPEIKMAELAGADFLSWPSATTDQLTWTWTHNHVGSLDMIEPFETKKMAAVHFLGTAEFAGWLQSRGVSVKFNLTI